MRQNDNHKIMYSNIPILAKYNEIRKKVCIEEKKCRSELANI